MPAPNGRGGHGGAFGTEGDEDVIQEEAFDPAEYDTMLRLERLESLEEEMEDLGITSLDEVRRQIAELHRKLDEDPRKP